MRRAWPWPLPALLVWATSWAVFVGVGRLDAGQLEALIAAAFSGAALASLGTTPWRRLFIGGGFPLSMAASGCAGSLPAWGWLLPLGLLAALYPVRAWRDAPLFPTPPGALTGLARRLVLADGAHILDAGCGLGHGLVELRREYPGSVLVGMEWSALLRFGCALRCRFARILRVDMWTADWSSYDLVYVFQRPESMPRFAEKAARELRDGAWLASLEFEIGTLRPADAIACADGRTLWIYRAPFAA